MATTNRLGAELSAVRRRRGLSQRKLAELSDISNTTIASLERGKGSRGPKAVRPTPETLRALARGLATDLIGGDVNRVEMHDHYSRFMRAAGYDWLLWDSRDLAAAESAPDKEGAFYDELATRDEAEAILENLESAIQNGAAQGRMLKTIAAITEALLDQVDPEKRYRLSSVGSDEEE